MGLNLEMVGETSMLDVQSPSTSRTQTPRQSQEDDEVLPFSTIAIGTPRQSSEEDVDSEEPPAAAAAAAEAVSDC